MCFSEVTRYRKTCLAFLTRRKCCASVFLTWVNERRADSVDCSAWQVVTEHVWSPSQVCAISLTASPTLPWNKTFTCFTWLLKSRVGLHEYQLLHVCIYDLRIAVTYSSAVWCCPLTAWLLLRGGWISVPFAQPPVMGYGCGREQRVMSWKISLSAPLRYLS